MPMHFSRIPRLPATGLRGLRDDDVPAAPQIPEIPLRRVPDQAQPVFDRDRARTTRRMAVAGALASLLGAGLGSDILTGAGQGIASGAAQSAQLQQQSFQERQAAYTDFVQDVAEDNARIREENLLRRFDTLREDFEFARGQRADIAAEEREAAREAEEREMEHELTIEEIQAREEARRQRARAERLMETPGSPEFTGATVSEQTSQRRAETAAQREARLGGGADDQREVSQLSDQELTTAIEQARSMLTQGTVDINPFTGEEMRVPVSSLERGRLIDELQRLRTEQAQRQAGRDESEEDSEEDASEGQQPVREMRRRLSTMLQQQEPDSAAVRQLVEQLRSMGGLSRREQAILLNSFAE